MTTKETEDLVLKAKDDLEQRVQAQTAELRDTVEALEKEIVQREEGCVLTRFR